MHSFGRARRAWKQKTDLISGAAARSGMYGVDRSRPEAAQGKSPQPGSYHRLRHYRIISCRALVAHDVGHRGGRPPPTAKREHGGQHFPLQWELDAPLRELSAKLGPARATQIFRASARTVQEIFDLTRSLDIDCQCAGRPSLYLAATGWAHES